jgi:ATP-binding cassette subfamily B protein
MSAPSNARVFVRLVAAAPGTYALDALLQLFRGVIPLVPGLVAQAAFDWLSSGSPLTTGFWLLLSLLVGAALARVTALLTCVVTDATCEVSGQSVLTRNVLRRLLARPGALGTRQPVGDVVNRLTTDTTTVTDPLVFSLMVLGSAAQALIAVGIMLSISWQITLIVLVPLVAAGVLINVTSTRIRTYHAQSRRADGEVSGFLREVFDSIQPIKLANADDRVMARFRDLNETRRRSTMRSRLFTNTLLASIWSNTAHLAIGVVLLLAAASFRNGTFTVGDFALFVAYLGWTTDFTVLFSQNLTQYKQAGESLRRLADVVDPGTEQHVEHVIPAGGVEPAPPRPAAKPLRTLEVRGLTCRHPGSGRGIVDVDLTIQRGAFVVVTGQVGAGKTTLLRALLGLLPRQDGVIRWNGEEVTDPAGHFVPPRSAYTAQVPRLWSATIRDNIVLGDDVDPDALTGAIHTAVFDRDLPDLADGLDTMVGPKGAKLSGGQLKRVAAARMVVRGADLLVMDDLSSALDVRTEQLLWRRMSALDATCLVVSNRRAALEHATLVVELDEGRIVSAAPPDFLGAVASPSRRPQDPS